MDPTRFDSLTRIVASTRSRRGLLKALAGILAGGLLAGHTTDRAAANKGHPPANHGCLHPNAACARDDECCSGACCYSATSPTLPPPKICCHDGEVCTSPPGAGLPTCCRSEDICEVERGLHTLCCAPDEFCDPLVGFCVPCIASAGAPCAADGDCCSGHCVNDACAPCVPAGGDCGSDADCCADGVCADGTCQPPCQSAGARCGTTADCCTGSACRDGRCSTLQPPPGQ